MGVTLLGDDNVPWSFEKQCRGHACLELHVCKMVQYLPFLFYFFNVFISVLSRCIPHVLEEEFL